MPQQLLHRTNVGARLQQMRGKRVAQRVNRNGFDNARSRHGLF